MTARMPRSFPEPPVGSWPEEAIARPSPAAGGGNRRPGPRAVDGVPWQRRLFLVSSEWGRGRHHQSKLDRKGGIREWVHQKAGLHAFPRHPGSGEGGFEKQA